MKRIKKRGETIYYSSFDQDVEAISFTERIKIDENYKYENKNIFYKIFSFIIYWFIAHPILSLVCIFKRISIKNKKVLKKVKNKGYFLYGNHISNYDAFMIQAYVIWSKKVFIIAFSDALSIPIVKFLANGLGLIPLGENIKCQINMMKYMRHILDKKKAILIYPEGHEWPYYSKLRPFKEGSFHYPSKFNAPIVPFVTIVKERKIFKKLKPKLEIHFLEPIFPKTDLSLKENKDFFMNKCKEEMEKELGKHADFEYYNYKYKEKEN